MNLLATIIIVAFSAPEPLRLIETAPGKRVWLSEAEIHEISHKQHSLGKCGGFMDVTDWPQSADLSGTDSFLLELDGPPKRQETVNRLMGLLEVENLENNVRHLSTAFPNRKHNTQSGVNAAQWIKSQYERYAINRQDISVETVSHNFIQPSVIATIKGTEFPDEIVVMGGHLDSIAGFFGSAAPGADDNASGTSVVMEAFRVLAESGHQPKRTLQFMGYAGEERGLLGSQDIANRYKNENKKVVAVMQFDMTMFPANTQQMTFITDNTNADLTAYVKTLLDEYVKISWSDSQCGYACSDHASWHRKGYPAVFPFEAPMGEHNKKIHTPQDVLANLNPGFGMNFAKLAVAYAVEMGNP